MADIFLDNLNRKNISKDGEKTKTRVQEVWKSAAKKDKRALLQSTGHSIYKTITTIGETGSMTARNAVLMSRYLDVNPLYLTGESNERSNYDDKTMKKFLAKLGYDKLWKEYVKYSKSIAVTGSAEPENESGESEKTAELTDEQKHEIEIEFDRSVKQLIKDTADEYHREHKHDVLINTTPIGDEEASDLLEEYGEDDIPRPKAESGVSLYDERQCIMIDRLSKKNISKDGGKTKQRVADVWKSASKEERAKVKNLASNIYTTIKNITETGTITAKAVISLSYVLNINPFYLTGETDKHGNCSDDLLIELLTNLEYKNLKKPNEKSEDEAIDLLGIVETAIENIKETIAERQESNEFVGVEIDEKPVDFTPEIQSAADNLSEDEIITLIRALLIRAKAGNADSSQIARQIKLLLLLN